MRLTKTEYKLMTDYGYGLEEECRELTLKDARYQRKTYFDNCPAIRRIVIKPVRVRIFNMDIKRIKSDINGNSRYNLKLFNGKNENITEVLLNEFFKNKCNKDGSINVTEYDHQIRLRTFKVLDNLYKNKEYDLKIIKL
jgi:hypothetical protein